MDEIPTFDELPPDDPSPFGVFEDTEAFDYGEGVASEPEGPAVPPSVRRESLRQRKHFATTGQFVLHDGPRVRVVAKTLLIHKDGKPHGVNLQLARQRYKPRSIPNWVLEPAAIYVNGDETEELYARLTEARLNVAELAETEYLVVRTGARPDITGLEALLRMVADNPAQFVPLTHMVGPDQLDALHAVVNIGRFRQARDELAEMVEKNPPERVFQRWFEENDWVFGTEYVARLTKARHIAPDSIIDLMFVAVDGFVDVFELKRPGPDVFVPQGTYLVPSPPLNEAFGQAVHYLAEADNMAFFNKEVRHVPLYRPRVRLVIGRSKDWTDDHFRTYREMTTAWNRVELLTYDMVMTRIDLLIKTMLRELRERAATSE